MEDVRSLGAMTTTQRTHHSDAGAPDVVQLGLFESDEPETRYFVHPNHRAFAALSPGRPPTRTPPSRSLPSLSPSSECRPGVS